MELYAAVRLAVVDEGLSHHEAGRRFGIDRRTVKKMLSYSAPPGYRRTKPVRRPKLDGFTGIVDAILEADTDPDVPRKQRHTAHRIFERLRDEHGFSGGYTIVKDYVRSRRQSTREAFVPLHHPPGHAQVDFGEAVVELRGQREKVAFFCLILPHSNVWFVKAYPRETTEAFLDGHVSAFAFLGGVPRSILYDNTTLAVARILGDGTRRRTQAFSHLQSHYLFRDRFGRPGNIAWLRENGYRYLAVSRERTRRFDPDLALAIETRSRQTVHVHKAVDAEGGEARLYCYSEARAKKEQGIANRFAARFEGEMSKLNDGLKRPRTRKRLDHVWQRIGRIREKSRGAAAHYDIDVIADDSGEKARAVTWERRPLAGTMITHPGVYCLRTNVQDWDEETLWRTYTSLAGRGRVPLAQVGTRPAPYLSPQASRMRVASVGAGRSAANVARSAGPISSGPDAGRHSRLLKVGRASRPNTVSGTPNCLLPAPAGPGCRERCHLGMQ